MSKITFNNSNNIFFQSLKKAVESYFSENQLKKTGNWKLYTKTVILIPSAITIYILLLTIHLPVIIALALCMLLGLMLACIGFNIMHDACHGSYSDKKWMNNLLGLTLNAIGGNAFFWKQKHNIIHHTYTNIEGADDDIAQSKLLRQSPTQKWMPIHKYQHVYLTLAYSLTLFMWVSIRDFQKYFTKKIHNTTLHQMDKKEHIMFWTSKVLYVFFYILLPILTVGPLAWFIGYATMGITTGILISYVFQLAHAVEGPEFDSVGIEDKMIETEWAVHQIKTTANFAPRNKVLSWLLGGLNFQVEHHLFPRISHIHYPALSLIVRQHCVQHGLPYHCFNRVSTAISSHVRTMKKLGRNPYIA
ncbi:fatty acid desaturase family protein [Niastella sp. OAS944]|uniref:fatty acid desaturase family protein n=1 Tax=Niastella sp. OAS944 TaxID=2664089 RepID=UPI00347E14C0|nr:linoleoyl-CoA desaturase [Chitinophagaceae bacterium OAS944]